MAVPSAKSRRALRRDPAGAIAGGIIAGLGERFGIEVALLRILFVVAVVLTGGLLLAAYAIAWVTIPSVGPRGRPVPARESSWAGRRGVHLGAGVALLTLAALLVFRELGVWWSDAVVWPSVLAAGGAALLWGQSRARVEVPAADPSPRAALRAERQPDRDDSQRASALFELYRGGFGVALVIGAALLFLSQNDALGGARDAAFTSIAAVLALALILAPFIWRLGRNLATERAERIRSQERAEVAAHLHDSVLQTLTLMQKRADDPREVAALARRQERELRGWLDARPDGESSDGFAAALRRAAEELEDAHRVKIEVVTVGDCQLDDRSRAVVGAAREALTNAAKFASEGGPISVFAEVGPERIESFVRDRGRGFDPDAAPADRRGVRESIIGRMQRHGGTATISSDAGSGTEVALTIERDAR